MGLIMLVRGVLSHVLRIWYAHDSSIVLTPQVKWVREMIDPVPKLVKRSLNMFAVPLGHNEANEFGVATYGLGQWSYTYRGHQVYG
jgi:hypothetical protein